MPTLTQVRPHSIPEDSSSRPPLLLTYCTCRLPEAHVSPDPVARAAQRGGAGAPTACMHQHTPIACMHQHAPTACMHQRAPTACMHQRALTAACACIGMRPQLACINVRPQLACISVRPQLACISVHPQQRAHALACACIDVRPQRVHASTAPTAYVCSKQAIPPPHACSTSWSSHDPCTPKHVRASSS